MYLMLPAYLANMAPPFTRFWRGWNRPISRKWLGEHKTVMGLCAGLTVALVVTFVRSKINWHEGCCRIPDGHFSAPRSDLELWAATFSRVL